MSSQDSLVRKTKDDNPLTTSMELWSRNQPSMASFRKHFSQVKEDIPTNDSKVSAKKSDVPSFISLRTALGQNSGKMKGRSKPPVEGFGSLQSLSSETVPKTKSPKSPYDKAKQPNASPKLPIQKTKKSNTSPKLPIEKATASDLEILRKVNPIAQYQC